MPLSWGRWAGLGLAGVALLATVSARAEWRASAGIGASYTQRSDLHLRQGASDFTVEGVSWQGRPFEMPPWYNLQVTYFAPRRPALGFTVGLLHMKVYADKDDTRHVRGTVDGVPVDVTAPMSNYVQKYNVSHGVNFVGFGVVGRLQLQKDSRFPNGRVEPYASLMIGPVINHPENTVLNVDNDQDYETNHGWGTMATLGIYYAVSHRWGFYTEVKRSHVADNVQLGGNGTGNATLNTTHLSTGVSYSF